MFWCRVEVLPGRMVLLIGSLLRNSSRYTASCARVVLLRSSLILSTCRVLYQLHSKVVSTIIIEALTPHNSRCTTRLLASFLVFLFVYLVISSLVQYLQAPGARHLPNGSSVGAYRRKLYKNVLRLFSPFF